MEIDFMIDELENKVNILERKIGLTSEMQENGAPGQVQQAPAQPPQ